MSTINQTDRAETVVVETDRFLRQRDLIPRQSLQQHPVTIIGVGAIGRQVALQLAALGVSRLHLMDFDHVESHNVTTQGYLNRDIGQPKVAATAAAITAIDDTIDITQTQDRFRVRHRLDEVVFCCVDSISARAAIWRHARSRTALWIDGRMLGEVMRILTASDETSRTLYDDTLFAPSEAQSGTCTSRSTIYTANIASALMVHQFTRWVRSLPLDNDQCLNLLSSELTVS